MNPPEEHATEPARRFSLRQRFTLTLITWAGYLFLRLLGSTLRYKVVCEEGCLTDGFTGPPSIWCSWHRCVIPASYFLKHKQIAMLISSSFDGEYIARIVHKLGFRTVRGSSSRGAVGGLQGMRRELESGYVVGFTADGPRGPRYVAKPGPLALAQRTGKPVNGFYVAVKDSWTVNSWDQMLIPKPFSRACVYLSSPLSIPPDATAEALEVLRQQMQAMLDRCRIEAEKAVMAQS